MKMPGRSVLLKMPGRSVFLSLSLLWALAACNGQRPQEPTPEAGPGLPPEAQVDSPRSVGSYDLSRRLEPGQVRAGIIRSSRAFIGGPNSSEQIGDIKIYNNKAAFVIEGVRLSHGYLPYGGTLAAADIVRPPGEAGQSYFGEFTVGFEHRAMKPERIEIVNDGSNGEAAFVRIHGKDAPLDLLQTYIRGLMPQLLVEQKELGLQILYEYRLEPDSSLLQMTIRVKNLSDQDLSIRFVEMGALMGDGAELFFPGKGFVYKEGVTGGFPYFGLANRHVGYLLFPHRDNPFQVLVQQKTIVAALHEAFDLMRNQERTLTWSIAVGRDLAAAQAVYRRARPGPSLGQISGSLRESNTQQPLGGVPVHLEQQIAPGKYNYIGQTITYPDGTFSVELPVGVYWLTATPFDRVMGERKSVSVGAGSHNRISLEAPATGRLQVAATETSTESALPVKVVIYRKGNALPTTPSTYHNTRYGGGAFRIQYLPYGSGEITLPPGTYRVVVCRGYEYTLHDKEYTIVPGQLTAVRAELQRVLQTPGALSGDFHVHAKGSPDSEDTFELKVAAMVGEGLEIAVSTDHEYLSDYQPVIQKMGLSSWIKGIVGEEITTNFGHFNAYPLPFDPSKLNNGAVWWYDLRPVKIFDLVYSIAPQTVLQINHPRSASIGGYFNFTGYDRNTGEASKKGDWSWRFDAVEVVNGKGLSKALKEVLPDWYSMLNRGYRKTAMGNSDSHHALTSEVGYPRNFLLLGSDDPRRLTKATVSQTVKAGRVVVSGGPMIHFSLSANKNPKSAVGLGESLSVSQKQVYLHIRVEAAPWLHLDRIEVIANGKKVWEKKLDKQSGTVLRFNDIVPLQPQQDTWYLVFARGSKKMNPVVPGATPFAFTNPIYVDVDNNGKFNPPLSN